MNRRNKISSVLAGVSFVALAAALSPASAGNVVIAFPTDFVVLDNDNDPVGDLNPINDVINKSEIGGGLGVNNQYGLNITDKSVILGDISNTSNAYITASYFGGPSGNADVAGVYIDEDAVLDYGGSAEIHNEGLIGGYSAVTGTNPSAYAGARGVDWNVDDVDVVNLEVDNEDFADIEASAFAVGGDAAADAVGVDIDVDDSKTSANVLVRNEGDILASAMAYATDIGSASAIGVRQDVEAGAGTATVYNEGDIFASAFVYDEGPTPNALGRAAGIDQSIDGTGNELNITNADSIRAIATVFAYGSTSASAAAYATGAEQFAYPNSSADVDFENTGDVSAVSIAVAYGNNYAGALSVAVGNDQYATADEMADVNFTNGTDGVNTALALGFAGAYDAEIVAWGVASLQLAEADENASATLKNDGYMAGGGAALAIGNTALAYGSGSAAFQLVFGEESVASINNSGDMNALGLGVALGYDEAVAYGWGAGMHQHAWYSNTGVADVYNDGDVVAIGLGIAASYHRAVASGTGVASLQESIFNGSSHNTAQNEGTMWGAGGALALSTNDAYAEANAAGIVQVAIADSEAGNIAANNGNIFVIGAAVAVGGSASTAPPVPIVSPSDPLPSDTSFPEGIASLIGNPTTIFANISGLLSDPENLQNPDDLTGLLGGALPEPAPSVLPGPPAGDDADAVAYATGLVQLSVAGEEAYAESTNSGYMGVASFGVALGADADAGAYSFGVYQEAIITGPDNYGASVDFTNEDMLNVGSIALALGNSAQAMGGAAGAYQHAVNSYGEAIAEFENDGSLLAMGIGVAYGGLADARSSTFGDLQEVEALDAAASAENHDTLQARGYALAWGTFAGAGSHAGGIVQRVAGGDAEAYAENSASGDIDVMSLALAYGRRDAVAYATASGIFQGLMAESGADADITNHGHIQASAVATAVSTYDADAHALGGGGIQFVAAGGEATADLTNTSMMSLIGYSEARALGSTPWGVAEAEANAAGGYQEAHSENDGALVNLENEGLIFGLARATALAAVHAVAYATALGFSQRAQSEDDAGAYAENSGTIAAKSFSLATSLNVADAYSTAIGLQQDVEAGDGSDSTATAFVHNEGSISGWARADAGGLYGELPDYANALVEGLGVLQSAYGYDDEDGAITDLVNDKSGIITAHGEANASAYVSAFAWSSAIALEQYLSGGSSREARLDNSGLIRAFSRADAYGELGDSTAFSWATGHLASTDTTMSLDVDNEVGGLISGTAYASGNDVAWAWAGGAWYEGEGLNGTVDNHGKFSAYAYADGANVSYATAQAIVAVASNDDLTITNTGIIAALAEASNAYATAVAFSGGEVKSVPGVGLGPTLPPVLSNEGGVLWAGVSDGKGGPITRGTAINTAGFTVFDGTEYGPADGPVRIQLKGGAAGSAGKSFVEDNKLVSQAVIDALSGQDAYGYVYGNMKLTPDESIDVTDGATIFDGIIGSPDEMYGELNIYAEGKFVMVQNDLEGPSLAYIDELNVSKDGTLAMELTTNDKVHPQVIANEANLSGNFVAIYRAGLYGDHMFYDNVIDADVRNGTFDNVLDNSALLDTRAVYDGGANVDLYTDRIAFDAVDGMTKNQKAAGSAIENVYDLLGPTIDTPFEQLVANLFTLNDGDYQTFLDQLTGAEHAQHLQSVLWSTRAIQRIITERMECDNGATFSRTASGGGGGATKMAANGGISPTSDVPMESTGCFEPGTASLWMRGFGQWNSLNGDSEAPGFDETQYGLIFGADYAFDENWFLGLAGGYFNSNGDFDKWGGRAGATYDYSGLQLAAYGGFDNSEYYLRGVVAYGNYSGESHRLISFNGSPIDPSGDPNSNTLSLYGETGYRFSLMDNANLTPFAGLSLATAKLDSFTEEDPENTGAALHVHDADASSIASVLGMRFEADMTMGTGVFLPSISVAWMHEFGDTAQEVDMSFASAPAGADFTVTGSDVARDSILVDAGAKFSMSDRVDMGLFYNGQFSTDYTSNAVTARLGYKF